MIVTLRYPRPVTDAQGYSDSAPVVSGDDARVIVCNACGFWARTGEVGQSLMVAHLMTSCSCGAHIETRP